MLESFFNEVTGFQDTSKIHFEEHLPTLSSAETLIEAEFIIYLYATRKIVASFLHVVISMEKLETMELVMKT